MITNKTAISGCYEIEFDRYGDDRGYFEELFSISKYNIAPGMQVSCSYSRKHVIRGLHCSPYYKLCTCVRGRMFDVAVDLREDSPTYLKWIGVWLSEDSPKQLLVPPGCGHGFYADAEDTLLIYLQGGVYNKELEKEIRWDDPTIAIQWPHSDVYIISDKDQNASFI